MFVGVKTIEHSLAYGGTGNYDNIPNRFLMIVNIVLFLTKLYEPSNDNDQSIFKLFSS